VLRSLPVALHEFGLAGEPAMELVLEPGAWMNVQAGHESISTRTKSPILTFIPALPIYDVSHLRPCGFSTVRALAILE
jgi:hypothetical protein